VINPIHVSRLKGIGTWLHANAESIYGTRAGVITPTASMVSTSSGGTHYVHLLEYLSDNVTLKGVPAAVSKAHLLRTGEPVAFERQDDLVVLSVPEEMRDPLDTVVVLN
jgi:alpha-L-fucosidase